MTTIDRLHALAPLLRDKAKAHRVAEEGLYKRVTAVEFSEAKGRALAEALCKAVAEMMLAGTKVDRQIFDILTPEQRTQLADMKLGADGGQWHQLR